MKRQKRMFLLGFTMLLVFLSASIVTFVKSNQIIAEGYLQSEGNAAENFAVLTASSIHLTDERVAALKQLSYTQLQSSPENEALRAMMSNGDFATKVDYAYVMVHLPPHEVQYQISETNQSLFNEPVGTDLDILWLLDVTVSQQGTDTFDAYYGSDNADLERYACYIEEDARILGSTPSYMLSKSGWGDHICGYAPLYSVEGTYIGALGVELQTADFDSYRTSAMRAIGILLAVSTLTLSVGFAGVYLHYHKAQFARIYTDPLTRVSNRSFYNDQFMKRLSAERLHPPCFALMISDIDWFKKVNDTFGHEAGDQVLLGIGEILLDLFGKFHVVRFGGEEFVVGLWVQDEEELRKKLDTLYDRITIRKFGAQQIDITLSLGCSWCAGTDLNGWLLSEMLRAADGILYEVKATGRKHYKLAQFHPSDGETPHAAN